MKKLFLFTALIFGTIIICNAQKINLVKGNLAPLQGEEAINIQFKYDNMRVGKMTEEDYLKKRSQELDDKDPGRGKEWINAWFADREVNFEPAFLALFNKHSKMRITEDPQNYTMIFHTTFTEPGFNVGVVRKNAEINATVTIVETDKPSNEIAVIKINNAPGRTGMGTDFATGDRITESYAISGKKLAPFIDKNRK